MRAPRVKKQQKVKVEVKAEFLNPYLKWAYLIAVVVVLSFCLQEYLAYQKLIEALSVETEPESIKIILSEQNSTFMRVLAVIWISSSLAFFFLGMRLIYRMKKGIMEVCQHFEKFGSVAESKKMKLNEDNPMKDVEFFFNRLISRRVTEKSLNDPYSINRDR